MKSALAILLVVVLSSCGGSGSSAPLAGYKEAQSVIHASGFGAIPNDEIDDTEELQLAANAAAVGRLVLDGGTYLVSASLVLPSGCHVVGPATIKATTAMSGPVISAPSCSQTKIEALTVDGNSLAHFGISLSNGSGNHVNGCYVHDTVQAGIILDTETNATLSWCSVVSCGREGYASNHGILIYSITAETSNILVSGCTVISAFRKGITTYCADTGSVRNVRIVDCATIGCGLGGVYSAGAPGSTPQRDIVVHSLHAEGSYLNVELANVIGGSISGCTISDSTGAPGIEINACQNIIVSGNVISRSHQHGIKLSNGSASISVTGNHVSRSNMGDHGFAAGIDLNSATASLVTGNIISESGLPIASHGIIDEMSSTTNVISGNVTP